MGRGELGMLSIARFGKRVEWTVIKSMSDSRGERAIVALVKESARSETVITLMLTSSFRSQVGAVEGDEI